MGVVVTKHLVDIVHQVALDPVFICLCLGKLLQPVMVQDMQRFQVGSILQMAVGPVLIVSETD